MRRLTYKYFRLCNYANANFTNRKIAIKYIVIVTSLALPVKILMNTKLNIPNVIPSAMLYAIGIMMMVKNAGIDSDISLKSTSTTLDIINKPTITSAEAVAAAGMVLIVFTFMFVDLFDTVGTLVGVALQCRYRKARYWYSCNTWRCYFRI